jgi:hypothetical protein
LKYCNQINCLLAVQSGFRSHWLTDTALTLWLIA